MHSNGPLASKPIHEPRAPAGWGFGTDFAGADGDPIYGAATVRDLYERLAGGQKVTKFTVPMLVDTKTDTIVNNEVSRGHSFPRARTRPRG